MDKPIRNITWETIDKSTVEGQMLLQAVCVLCGVNKHFHNIPPSIVFEFVKDTLLYPLVDEPIADTISRLMEIYYKKYN